MESIWKFNLEITDSQSIKMPIGAKFLSVQVQNKKPALWVLVESTNETEERIFWIYGTGHPCYSNLESYIGTFQMNDGDLVFHVFGK